MNECQIEKIIIKAIKETEESNGHQYMTILKTKCVFCHRSPKQKGRCQYAGETLFQNLFTEFQSLLSKMNGDFFKKAKRYSKNEKLVWNIYQWMYDYLLRNNE